MLESFYPSNIPLLVTNSLDLSRMLFQNKEKEFLVHLADENFVIKAKWLMVNIFLWRPLVKRNLPVEKRHTHYKGLITPKSIALQQTEIFNDVIKTYSSQGIDIPVSEERSILSDLCDAINDLHTMIATQLGEYHLSISAFELADLFLNPEVAPLTELDVSREMMIGITAAEEKIKLSGKKLVEKLKDRSLPSNVIAPFLELGQLNENQLVAMFLAIGYRATVSDNVVRKPILTSYMKGLTNIIDYTIETFMAMKTVYYNKIAMPNSSYDSRKQQLLSSSVRRLYPGDCGTTVTTPLYVHKDNFKHIVGKHIIGDNRLITLSFDNVENYIGSTINMRSPLTCRHTDGMCHVCGGALTNYMSSKSVVGIACTVEYMAKVNQLVLSAKHFSTTKAIAYVIPDVLKEVLVVRQNDIYIREEIDVDRLKVGIQFQDIPHIMEIKLDENSDSESLISEQQFSSINQLIFANGDNDRILTPEVPMMSDGIVPYFSSEMITFLRNNFCNVTITEDMVWISLKRFDHINEPFLKCIVQSNSMIRFTKALSSFATSEIKNYTTLGEALRDLSDMVFREIGTNIFHVETVLKSYLITSETDYNIPIVTDPNNVMFGTLPTIMPRRSLGALFAFEKLGEYMEREPELYLLPHKAGVFDCFFFPED